MLLLSVEVVDSMTMLGDEIDEHDSMSTATKSLASWSIWSISRSFERVSGSPSSCRCAVSYDDEC